MESRHPAVPSDAKIKLKLLESPKLTYLTILKRALVLQTNMYTPVLIVVNIVITYISIYSSVLYGRIIGLIATEFELSELNQFCFVYIAILVGEFVLRRVLHYFSVLTDKYFADLSIDVLEAIMEKDCSFFDYFNTSEILNLVDHDISRIQECSPNNIYRFIQNIIKISFVLFSICRVSSMLLSIQFSFLIFLVYMTLRKSKSRIKSYDSISQALRDASNLKLEMLNNIKLIKAFSSEKFHLNEYKMLRKRISELTEFDNFLSFESYEVMNLVTEITKVILLLIGGREVSNGQYTVSVLATYHIQMSEVCFSVKSLIFSSTSLFESLMKLQKTFQIIDYPSSVVDQQKNMDLSNLKGEIEFRDVSFSYPLRPDAMVISKLNLKVSEGEIIAIVGQSGSGKSTIISLLQRLYDPNEGVILIDGINLKDYSLSELHGRIGYVNQEPILFQRSIEQNIFYNSSASISKLNQVSQLSCCDNFIEKNHQLPEGYKTEVKSGNLSGGQKQRIAIARALMKEYKILIFDEATSSLDSKCELEVQTAIDNIIKAKSITAIIIAHRLSTVRNCDRIIVVKNGEIAETGTHKDLIMQKGYYWELVNAQMVE